MEVELTSLSLFKQMGLAQNLVKIILVNNVTILMFKLKLKYISLVSDWPSHYLLSL